MIPLILLPGDPETYRSYAEALEAAGGRVLCSLDPGAADVCQGLLLPGGGDLNPVLYGQFPCGSAPPDDGRDRRELVLVNRFTDAALPILGVCRGAQVLNVALGGTLIQDLPGHAQIDGLDRLHSVRAEPGSLPARLYGAVFPVNSAHHQAVGQPGEGLRIVCRAADGTAEAVEHESLPILGVQWHPERLTGRFFRPGAVDGAVIFDYFLSKCAEGIR